MLVQVSKSQNIELRIFELDSLISHEQTIPSLLDSVKRDMERTGYQRDPIIVDTDTEIILDGMHRRAALESLGANFALCACFNYLDEKIILQRWLRYFIAPDRQMIDELIGLFDLEKVENYQNALSLVDSRKSPIALLSSKQSYVSRETYDLQTVYRRLGDFDRLASQRGIQVEFHPDNEETDLFLSESLFVLYPMAFRKEDIIRVATNHKLLPYKTTRHIVPIRPMGLYFPLDLLKQRRIEICDSKLKEIVSESKVDLVEPNSWYEGRKYSEALAIFKRSMTI